MSTATATTASSVSMVWTTLPITWPARTAPRGIDIVRKREMIPVVMSMETVIAVDCVPPTIPSSRIPGVT